MNLTGRRERYKAFVKDGGGEIRTVVRTRGNKGASAFTKASCREGQLLAIGWCQWRRFPVWDLRAAKTREGGDCYLESLILESQRAILNADR